MILQRWIVDMEGAPGTLYEGEKFQLLFKFSSRYPFDSPQRRPPDNSFYVRTCNKNPKKTKWWYHENFWIIYLTQHLHQLYSEFHIDFLRVAPAASKTEEDLPDEAFIANPD
ncbi:UNVERIFIED_CONTAM: hypothetical protein H355_010669 [Colinus virginianus]|nr:hypothetical protein H355_010669 [Colinus virginianus]